MYVFQLPTPNEQPLLGCGHGWNSPNLYSRLLARWHNLIVNDETQGPAQLPLVFTS